MDEEISVHFESLTIDDGLERIFSTMNHSFVFDQHGKLLGVLLLGKPDRKRRRGRRRAVTPRRVPRRNPRRSPPRR